MRRHREWRAMAGGLSADSHVESVASTRSTRASTKSKHRDIKLIIRDTYCTADALGEKNKSKAVTPSNYGETFEDPVRSILLVRAWALYQAQPALSGAACLERRSLP